MNALTWLLAALCLTLLAAAAVQAVRRREAGPALTGLTAAVALVAVTPRLSPYAEGKVLAIASPAILFTALWGAASLRVAARGRLGQAVPMGLAALAGIGVLASDARAYHWVRLAPADRMRALEDVADRFAGRGPMFLPEFEEYAKYFLRDAVFNGNEPLTPAQPQIRPEAGGYSFGAHYDLDLLAEGYLQQFPLVLLRRGPDASRPPANYRRAYANAHYEVWRRSAAGPEVRRHLGLQQLADATRRVPCPSLEAILADAAPGDRLVAAVRPPIVRMETAADGIRPAGWRTSIQQGQATPGGPGTAATELELDGGRMRVWVRGSFGREMHVRVDGRRIGTVRGINTPAQWLRAGEVTLRAGRHRVELVRPGGDFAPGDGAPPLVGPVAFEALRPPARLETVAVDDWRSLCGRRLDWVELVGR